MLIGIETVVVVGANLFLVILGWLVKGRVVAMERNIQALLIEARRTNGRVTSLEAHFEDHNKLDDIRIEGIHEHLERLENTKRTIS